MNQPHHHTIRFSHLIQSGVSAISDGTSISLKFLRGSMIRSVCVYFDAHNQHFSWWQYNNMGHATWPRKSKKNYLGPSSLFPLRFQNNFSFVRTWEAKRELSHSPWNVLSISIFAEYTSSLKDNLQKNISYFFPSLFDSTMSKLFWVKYVIMKKFAGRQFLITVFVCCICFTR